MFYLFPRTSVDRVLPLTIRPVPQDVQRVFVGRVEGGWLAANGIQ